MIQTTQQHESDGEKLRAIPWNLAQAVLNTIFALWTFNGSAFCSF